MINAPENRSAGGAKSGLIAEETRAPISAHGQGLNFEGELADVHIFADFAGGLRFARGVFQISEPFFHEHDDAVADAAGAIVEFERGSGKEAAAGERFIFAVGKPIFAERAKEIHAAEFGCGKDDAFDEDIASFVHDGALEIFLGAEVGEEAALADAEGGGEFADGKGFEAFEGGEVDGFAEDGVAGFQAAGAAAGSWWRFGGAGFVAGFRFHARIIARPFVLLQGRKQGGREATRRGTRSDYGDGRGLSGSLLQRFNTEGTEEGGGHGEFIGRESGEAKQRGKEVGDGYCRARLASPGSFFADLTLEKAAARRRTPRDPAGRAVYG